MSQPSNQELEYKISFLERHVQEQDMELLKIRKEMDKLSLLVAQLKNRLPKESDHIDPSFQKPPHY